jgi:alpha-glucosidase
MARILSWLFIAATAVRATTLGPVDPLASCPGYKASNVKTAAASLTADLKLAGKACNVYGTDLTDLTLSVVYETGRNST